MTVGTLATRQARQGAQALRRAGEALAPHAARLAIPSYLVIVGVFSVFRLLEVPPWTSPAFDLHAYWSTRGGLDYTTTRPGAPGAYLYSPAFALAITPLTWLSWPAFAALWTFAMASILVWLAGRWSIVLLLALPVLMSVTVGQVDLLLAAAIVIGFRYPAAWALPILTKVTPGISVLWFAVRREWRSFGIALGATLLLAAISFAIDPADWFSWVGMLSRGQFPTGRDGLYVDVPLGWRLAAAVLVVVWGARSDRRWTVPLAAVIAMPTIWINSPAMLVAVLPLVAAGARTPAGRWLRGEPMVDRASLRRLLGDSKQVGADAESEGRGLGDPRPAAVALVSRGIPIQGQPGRPVMALSPAVQVGPAEELRAGEPPAT